MHTIYIVLYVIAAVCFLLDAFAPPTRIHLLALGLAAWVGVPLIQLLNR